MTFLLSIHSLIALKEMYILNKNTTTIKIIELASAGSFFASTSKYLILQRAKTYIFYFFHR